MAKTGLILTNQVNPAQSAQLAALPGIARVITPPADQPLWQIPPETDILYTMPKDAWKDAPETAPPGWPGKLRLVHTISAGIDGLPRWLMDAPLMSRGRGTTAGPIAEYVMAALLEGEKRLGAALSTTGTTGDEAIAYGTLQGKVLAIAGFGAVGQEIAKRARGFDMVLRSIRRSGPGMAEGVEFAPSLEALIDGADMMVIALPQTEATTGAVNAALLAHATPHLHLINIARGSIVDQDALVDFLTANPLARATLDVTTPEPLPDDHPLMTHPQARITPHIAWRNPDFRERNLLIFRETLAALIAGAPLPGRVDPAQGY